MCGIFGICAAPGHGIAPERLNTLVNALFTLSESRGKEAAGLAVRTDDTINIYKEAVAATEMIGGQEYTHFFEKNITRANQDAPLYLIGHARLVTNGLQDMDYNNQPVIKNGLVGVHNGIITNDSELWKANPDLSREYEVDTEVVLALINKERQQGVPFSEAVCRAFKSIEGNATLSLLADDRDGLLLATNNGSLYYMMLPQASTLIFASERLILQELINACDLKTSTGPIHHLTANRGLLAVVSNANLETTPFMFEKEASTAFAPPVREHRSSIIDTTSKNEEARQSLRRCTKCILPETMPFIEFDTDGVCNYCRTYKPMTVKPESEAEIELAPHRRGDNEADCLVMLSGGRDSCFGLHHAVTKLGMKPVAYTYDWGMVTDIARRNAARLCGKLGVEHIIVSADIAWKRKNIRKNIEAWLKKPDLGMVPLFMAGDKQYFYYAHKVREANRLPITIVSENPLEYTKFKAGYCGVDESCDRIYNIPLAKRIKLLSYYGQRYLTNPAYINSTLWDNARAFWASYFMKHDYFFLSDYHRWDEKEVVSTLQDEYNWETDPECYGTWRIGDGTAAFYNYIYYTVSGFTENDTLRSNQIREGDITREKALKLVELENQPRWESLKWYASVVGFNLTEAIQKINAMPKLYI